MQGSSLSTGLFNMVVIFYTFSARGGKDGDSPNVVHAFDNNIHIIRKLAGDQIRFDCAVSNVTQAVWQRSTDISSGFLFAGINSSVDNNLYISIGNFSLYIHTVMQEDEGTYKCIEKDKTKAEYLLIVKALSPCSEEGRKSCEGCCSSDVIQKDLKEMQEIKVNVENVEEVAEQLEQVSDHAELVDTDGLESIVHILNDIVNTNTSEEQVEEVTESVLNIASNIMEVENEVTDQVSGVGNVPHLLEQQAATLHSKRKNYSQVLDNVGFSAVQISQSALQKGVTFGSFGEDNSAEHEIPPLSKNHTGLHYDEPSTDIVSAITLPSSLLEVIDNASSNTTTIPLSFLIYRDASIFPVKGRSNQSTRTVISSHVISATVALNNIEIKNLPDDSQVGTTFYAFPIASNEEEVEEKRECVFWKYNEGGGSGEWSRDGCRKVNDLPEKRQVKCLCNHLTSFAVLVHVRVVNQPSPYSVDLIFRIGCVLSIVGLFFCILTMLSFRSIRIKQQSKIHTNLCIALVALYLTFLVGIDRTKNPLRCKLVASLIHYFALSSMAWMSVEAVNMFLLFWMMRRSPVSNLIQVSIVVAWGGPLVAAVLVFFLDKSKDNDRRLSYCFLHPGNGLYFGFLLLIGLLFLFNCVIFVLITYKVTCRKIFATNEEAKRKERIARLRGTFLFWVLLGISWGFGFFSIILPPPFRTAFEVLFAVCLTLQGVCMFYIIVLKNHEVKIGFTRMTGTARNSLRESIRIKRWRYVPGDSYMAYFQTTHKATSEMSGSVAAANHEDNQKEVDNPQIIS
ncbi:Adhesion G-protein coupled receptor G6 [Holothuria leucospilota]|uniref:Adhesion G-protein coupled receptor G6 n=1 Tax=Holothuria leucospilota TaxID=206669 RepID=A0A9Q1CCX0_HOLLE|nr:Adhesion G-protein coupled receptor G6 [Holothuria leucospilota]